VGKYYGVFATYRREFIEELVVLKLVNGMHSQRLQRFMRTFSEIAYAVPCRGSKYEVFLPFFKVFEGGDELISKSKYCNLVNTVLCMVEKRGLINPPELEFIPDLSEKCLLGDVYD